MRVMHGNTSDYGGKESCKGHHGIYIYKGIKVWSGLASWKCLIGLIGVYLCDSNVT